jgi:bis(5'-nucleosyl)-tetraphosphatase (symmetrical)
MTIYAIGNIRGNLNALLQLLDKIQFAKETDTLWFTGDLVNTGPDSLAILRFVKDLDKQAVTVLGQQELRLLAIAEGVEPIVPEDVFDEILAAPDRDNLLKWLRQCPFLHRELNYTLVHAGIPAEWSLSQAQTLALEAETSLSMGNHKTFLENIFADDPTRWHAKHRGWKRVRFIVNAFTRMRYCAENGRLDFSAKSPLGAQPEGYVPWYRMANRAMANQNIIFGHWFGLDDEHIPGIFPLHSSCASAGSLSALKISSSPEKISVVCS